MCVLRGEETKEWSLGSTLQFLLEKAMDDVSAGVKCGNEGHEKGDRPGKGTHLFSSGVAGQTEAWRKSGSQDALAVVPKPMARAEGAGS